MDKGWNRLITTRWRPYANVSILQQHPSSRTENVIGASDFEKLSISPKWRFLLTFNIIALESVINFRRTFLETGSVQIVSHLSSVSLSRIKLISTQPTGSRKVSFATLVMMPAIERVKTSKNFQSIKISSDFYTNLKIITTNLQPGR